MPKKVHWTKTRAGKRRWAEIQRKGARERVKQLKASQRKQIVAAAPKSTKAINRRTAAHVRTVRSQEIDEATLAYALGHIECWLQTFARSAAVPAESLAARLGEVLSGQVHR